MRRMFLALCLVACSNCSKNPEPTVTPPPQPTPVASSKGGAPADGNAGPKKEGQGFVLEVTPPSQVGVGTPASAQIVLKPSAGYHVNKEYPTLLEISPPAGVEVVKATQTPEDAAQFEETGAAFEVKFTSKDAGDKKFTANMKFAVCTATTCDPKRETLAWNVNVK